MEREDYLDPQCVLCGKPGQEAPEQPIPVQRVLEKLDEYQHSGDTAGAERHLKYWLAEAEMNRDERGQLTLHNELMGLYRMSGREEEATAHSEKALELVSKLGMDETVTAGTTWLNAGTVRAAFGKPDEGIGCFEKARASYEKNLKPSDPRLGGLYNNMGLCLTALGRYREAEAVFLRAIEVMGRQEHGEAEQAITWLNLADAAEAELGSEAAEEKIGNYLDRAAELLDTPGLPRNSYYGFVCDKCAPVFGRYGYFLEEAELHRRVEKIRSKSPG